MYCAKYVFVGDKWDIKLFSTILKMYSNCGDPSKALELWDSKISQYQPDTTLHAIFFGICANIGTPGMFMGHLLLH